VDIEAGKTFAEAHCSGCHTLDGRGKTGEIPNLAAQPASYLAEAMRAYRDGSRSHAALKETISGCSDADIENIAGFFSSLPPVFPGTTIVMAQTGKANQQGAEVARKCESCHGERGVSTTPGTPSLAGQQPAYLMISTQEYISGGRGHVGKEGMLTGLGDVDIEKMAMYFAAQAPEQREAPPFGDVAAGEPLTAQCGACHGARGVGSDPMVPNLAGQEPVYLVNAIKAYRSRERGHEDMITDKSDEQVDSIAAWYSVQSASSALETIEPAGEAIAKCDRCHDQAHGESSMVLPVLYGQNHDYLLRVMKEYRDGKRGNSMMHKMSAGYSDQLLEEMAAYYASTPQ